MTHFSSHLFFQFSPFRPGRTAGFAAAKKGPEASGGPAFEAPKTKPETKELKELAGDAALTLDKVKLARDKFDAAMKKARDDAKASYEKSPRAKKDNDAYDAFRRDMDDLDREAVKAREDARDKLAEIEARKRKDLEDKLAISKEQGDWEKKFKREPEVLDAQRKKQMDGFMIIPPAKLDAANEAFRHPDGWRHEFSGYDNSANDTDFEKSENYRNKDRSFAEGYYRAMIMAGKEDEAKKTMLIASDGMVLKEINGDRMRLVAGVDERRTTEVDSWMKGGKPGEGFLTSNEPVYVATMLRLAEQKWSGDSVKLAAYRDFIQKRLGQIGPAIAENTAKGRAAKASYGTEALKEYVAACARERNLVMNTIPTPDDFEAGKAVNLDNPSLSEADVQAETARRRGYADKVSKYVANFDALFGAGGKDGGGWDKAAWEADIKYVMQKNPDGNYTTTDYHSPESIQKYVGYMEDYSVKKMDAMRAGLAKIKDSLPEKAVAIDGHLGALNGKDVFTVDPAALKAASDFERVWATVLDDPDMQKRLGMGGTGAGGGRGSPDIVPGGVPPPVVVSPPVAPDGAGGSGDKGAGGDKGGEVSDDSRGGRGGGRRRGDGGSGDGGGGREDGPDKEKTPFERRTEALNDLRKNYRLETLTLPVGNPYLSIDAGGKITYKKKLLAALNGGYNWKLPLSDIVRPKDGVKIDVAGGGKNDVAVGNGNEFVNENGSDKDGDKKGDPSYIGEGYVLKLKSAVEKKTDVVAKTMVWDGAEEGSPLDRSIKSLPEKYQLEYKKILNNTDSKNFGIVQINDRVKRGELASPHSCTVDGVKFFVLLGSPVDARVKMPVDASSNMNTTWSLDAAGKNVVKNMNFWLYDRIAAKAKKEKDVAGGVSKDALKDVVKGAADKGADKKVRVNADMARFEAKITSAKAEVQKDGGKRVVYVGEVLDGRLPLAARPEVSYDAVKKVLIFTYDSKACKDEAEFKQKIRAGVEKYYEEVK